jgi:hypothetical protein
MITSKTHAAQLAVRIAQQAFADDAEEALQFHDWATPQAQELFDEVVQHRLSAESFYLHQQGKGTFNPDLPYAERAADVKLCFTLFTVSVPILNALIEAPAAAAPTLAASSYETLIEEDDHEKTIYATHDWGRAAQVADEAGAEQAADPIQPGTDAGGNGPEDGSVRALDADEPGHVSANIAGHAAVPENPLPDKPVILARPDTERAGEGGDVVDEDEEASEGGSVDGDEANPAVTDSRKSKRRK